MGGFERHDEAPHFGGVVSDRPPPLPKLSATLVIPPALRRRRTALEDESLGPEELTPVDVPIPRYTPPPRRSIWPAIQGWGTDACAMASIVTLASIGTIDGKTAVSAILIVVVARLRPPPPGGPWGGSPPGGIGSLLGAVGSAYARRGHVG